MLKLYNDASEYCVVNGMRLFIIDSATTQTAMIAALNTVITNPSETSFYINGQSDANGEWFTSPPKTPLFNGIDLRTALPKLQNLVLKTIKDSITGKFFVLEDDNKSGIRFLCEYV